MPAFALCRGFVAMELQQIQRHGIEDFPNSQRLALTNRPTVVTNGGNASMIARACCTSPPAGSWHKHKPMASAPASTAANASSMRVIPQILLRTADMSIKPEQIRESPGW
jgi:hypothetical protein